MQVLRALQVEVVTGTPLVIDAHVFGAYGVYINADLKVLGGAGTIYTVTDHFPSFGPGLTLMRAQCGDPSIQISGYGYFPLINGRLTITVVSGGPIRVDLVFVDTPPVAWIGRYPLIQATAVLPASGTSVLFTNTDPGLTRITRGAMKSTRAARCDVTYGNTDDIPIVATFATIAGATGGTTLISNDLAVPMFGLTLVNTDAALANTISLLLWAVTQGG